MNYRLNWFAVESDISYPLKKGAGQTGMIYRVNEFEIDSEFHFPCHIATCQAFYSDPVGKVSIRYADLSNLNAVLRKVRPQLVYDVGDGFLVEPPYGFAFHIDLKATTLRIDCQPNNLEHAAGWLLNVGLGIATLIHGRLPIHGASLRINDRTIAIIAESGSGKSTFLWHLVSRGALFRNDDLIPTQIGAGSLQVYSSTSLFPKLQKPTVDRAGLKPEDLMLVPSSTGEEEYFVPIGDEMRSLETCELDCIFYLNPIDVAVNVPQNQVFSDDVTVEIVKGQEAFDILYRNIHAAWLLEKWMNQAKIIAQCHDVCKQMPIYKLTYPKSFALLDTLESTIREIVRTKSNSESADD